MLSLRILIFYQLFYLIYGNENYVEIKNFLFLKMSMYSSSHIRLIISLLYSLKIDK